MTEWHGSISALSLDDRLSLLAGTLAELGVARVSLASPGSAARERAARESDLPGLILDLLERDASATLDALDDTLHVEITREHLAWRTTNAPVAAALKRATLLG